jgi:hypothetical protein
MTTQEGLLTPIGSDPIKMRTSLYADDAKLFVRPIATDISNLQHLMHQFGVATGLRTNIEKSTIYQIRCEDVQISQFLRSFQVRQGQFPCKYLGLPL